MMGLRIVFLAAAMLVMIQTASAADQVITLVGKISFQQSEGDAVVQPVSVELVSNGGSPKSLELVRGSSRDSYSKYVRIPENADMMVYTFYRNIGGFESNGQTTNIVFKGRRVVLSSKTGEAIFQGEILKISDAELAQAGITYEESFDNLVKNGKLDAAWTYFGLYEWKFNGSVNSIKGPADNLVGKWNTECLVAREPGVFKILTIEYKSDGTGINIVEYYSRPDCRGKKLKFETSLSYKATNEGQILVSILIGSEIRSSEGAFSFDENGILTIAGIQGPPGTPPPVTLILKRSL